MFNNIHFVFEMETMKRFTYPLPITILQNMRQPKGAKLTDQECQALHNTELDATQLERDPEAFLQETAGWFESSYLWSIVSMACYSRALASARRHEQTLFLCQSVDFCEQVGSLCQGGLDLYKQMLAVPNVAPTSRLPGMALLHIGMRVRITTQILPPWAVQDAAATIMEIQASPHDNHRVSDSGDTQPAA